MKVWNITRLPKRQLGIQCPYSSCHKKAVVSRDWLEDRVMERNNGQKTRIKGRSCTYCFRTAEIPDEMRPRARS